MLVLIPTLGLVGAAVGSGVTLVVSNLVMHTLVVRKLGIRPSIVAALRRTATPTPLPEPGA
jgi:O-antigen/teichoic acid export membrane protein